MKNNAYSFAAKVDQEIEGLSDDAYHRRVGRAKKLREELYPISRLGLYFKQPGLAVQVDAFENNDAADGRISISGFWECEFDVQVTCDYGHEESLRDELLSLNGAAPCAGKIFRDRKTKIISASLEAVDCDQYLEKTADAVEALFRKKASLAYAKDTVLIIAFDEVKLRGRYSWSQLFRILDEKKCFNKCNFLNIYLLNCATNQIFTVF